MSLLESPIFIFVDPQNPLVGKTIDVIRKLWKTPVFCVSVEIDQRGSASPNVFDHRLRSHQYLEDASEEEIFGQLRDYVNALSDKRPDVELTFKNVLAGSSCDRAHHLAFKLNSMVCSKTSAPWDVDYQRILIKESGIKLAEASNFECLILKSGMSSQILGCYTGTVHRKISVDSKKAERLWRFAEKILEVLGYNYNLFKVCLTVDLKFVSACPAFGDPLCLADLSGLTIANEYSMINLWGRMLLSLPFRPKALGHKTSVYFTTLRTRRSGKLRLDPEMIDMASTFLPSFRSSFLPYPEGSSISTNQVVAQMMLAGQSVDYDLPRLEEYLDRISQYVLAPLPAILIIAPYSTTHILTRAMKEYVRVNGIDLHILAADDLSVDGHIREALDTSLYSKVYPFTYTENLEEDTGEMLQSIKSDGFNLIQVIVGAESGVPIADYLSEKLGTITNKFKLSKTRRSKYLTHEKLRVSNLRCCRQQLSTSLSEAQYFANSVLSYPVIAKPEAAADTEGVFKCHTDEDVAFAWNRVVNTKNKQGRVNQSLLIQEFLDGPEYVVNTVSYEGKHLLCMILKYKKRETHHGIAYDTVETVEYTNDPEALPNKLFKYTEQVLDVLNLKNGPAHVEIIVVRGEPCLVECNARMHGGVAGPEIGELAAGFRSSQHFLITDVFVNSAREFLRRWSHIQSGHTLPYEILKSVCLVYLSFPVDGILDEDLETTAQPILRLASVQSHKFYFKKGEKVGIPADCFTSSGAIVLCHESAKQVSDDLMRIRKFEKSGNCYKIRDPKTNKLLNTAKAYYE